MSPNDVAAHAARGTTRLLVGSSSTDPVQQRDELSAFAERLGLAGTTAAA
jgi:hypothetical protein